jgi:hypothetical protein
MIRFVQPCPTLSNLGWTVKRHSVLQFVQFGWTFLLSIVRNLYLSNLSNHSYYNTEIIGIYTHRQYRSRLDGWKGWTRLDGNDFPAYDSPVHHIVSPHLFGKFRAVCYAGQRRCWVVRLDIPAGSEDYAILPAEDWVVCLPAAPGEGE